MGVEQILHKLEILNIQKVQAHKMQNYVWN